MPLRPPASLLNPLLMERDRLTDVLSRTINQTFQAAEVGCVNKAGEVDRLVYFFLEGLPLIEDQFNLILRQHNVRSTLSGIFCHQTPKVEPLPHYPYRDKTCELGDILFLVTYGKRLRNEFLGNALLVQAKEDTWTVSGTLQEHLYKTATEFTYAKAGALSGQKRWLSECRNALWFWGFDGHSYWQSPQQWQTQGIRARSQSRLHHRTPFEVVLADLICGVAGRRARVLQTNSPDAGWSKIVDDLIRQTAKTTFTRRNAYVPRDKEKAPLRGEDAVRAINSSLGPRSPFLIRSSFARIFSIFDEELAHLGKELEQIGLDFEEDRFKREYKERFFEKIAGFDAPPPDLGDERPAAGDNDDGGCSFVIMDFSHP